jgi:hypothetical protein
MQGQSQIDKLLYRIHFFVTKSKKKDQLLQIDRAQLQET